MAFTLPKPTPNYIRELHSKLLNEWQGRLGIEREMSDLVHQRNEIETLAPNEKRNIDPITIHSGRAGGIIEHANGLLMAMPSFEMEPTSLATGAKREAEQVERVMAALFEQQLLRNDFWPAIGRDVLTYARAYIKAMPLPSVWTVQAGYPVRGKTESPASYMKKIKDWKASAGEFPFVIQHVPVSTILPLLDADDNVVCSLEEKRVPAYVLAEEMKSAKVKAQLASGNLQWYDELTCLEYTDHEYVAYYLTDIETLTGKDYFAESRVFFTPHQDYEQLRVWKHGLGKCPVVMIPGMKTELLDKEGRFKSFLADAKESLEGYDVLISRLATMVWTYYLPSYTWTLAETAAVYQGRERPELTVNLGGVTVKYADESLDPLSPPPGLPDANLLTEQLDDLIQRHTLEDVLFGRVAGSAPAFQVNLRINVARSKLTPLAQHMAQGITNVMDLFLRGVISLGEEVIIDGEEITPSMAKSALNRIAASIEPKSPQDRAQDLGTAKMALEFGLPWDTVAQDFLGYTDPATLRLEKDIQELEKLPQAQEAVLADALAELDLLTEQNDFEELAGVDTTNMSPEFQQALQQFMEAQGGGGGLGRGPFPEGGAPQTIAPRGLLTEKEQPRPGGVQVGTMPIL